MKKCIILSGLIEGCSDWISDIAKDAFVICADRGYAYAKEYNIKTDLLVGDFDSYEGELPAEDKTGRSNLPEIIKLNTVKDDTDTGICLKEAVSRGYSEITIIGGIGGRLSHTVANLQSMAKTVQKTGIVSMTDGFRKVTVLRGPATLRLNPKTDFPQGACGQKHYLSLFAQGGDCTGVSITGTFYQLSGAVLTCDYPLGVSNEITKTEAVISLEKGTLLVITE